jgi:ParB/RepB/Spo0J family partition protein
METQTVITDGTAPPPLSAISTSAEFQLLPLAKIRESTSNPRRHFDEAKGVELENSVRQKGVLVPIKVRPAEQGYEIVYGARRFRAAQAAGLAVIPSLVQVLTDQQVLEEQVVENLQRSDVHPLEEAEGYRELADKYGYTVEDLAAKVGKSKAYIYARMKLCAIGGEARDLFLQGKLTASTALYVARIPSVKLQEEAAREIANAGFDALEDGDKPAPMSAREAQDYIQRRFMLRLEDAPFALDDAALVKKAGACNQCPKRTGNQPELFADVQSADVCTDPDCFETKKVAHLVRLASTAKKQGKAVLRGDEVKKHFVYRDQLSPAAPFLKLDEKTQFDPGRTLRQVLDEASASVPQAGAPLQVTVAIADDLGKPVELVDREAAERLLKKAGIKPRATRYSSPRPSSTPKKDVEGEKQLQLRQAVVAKAIPQIVAAAEKKPLLAWTRILGAMPADEGHAREIATRRGLKGKGRGALEQLVAAAAKMPDAQARGLAVELCLYDFGDPPAGVRWADDYGEVFADACKLFGINLKQLEAVEKAAAAAPTVKKVAPAKAKMKAPAKKKAASK